MPRKNALLAWVFRNRKFVKGYVDGKQTCTMLKVVILAIMRKIIDMVEFAL